MFESNPLRLILDNVINQNECNDLIYILRSLGVLGYREYVTSATIFDVAAACPALLPTLVRYLEHYYQRCSVVALYKAVNNVLELSVYVVMQVKAREQIRTALEAHFSSLQLSLFIEFTVILAWRPGASIQWHADDNRNYLKQREYAAVLYLNDGGGVHFTGGEFLFQHHEPRQIQPKAGRLVAYAANDIHSVTEVTSGERYALAMWFSTDISHDEDPKLLKILYTPTAINCQEPFHNTSLPASMYGIPSDGTDIRLCRLAMRGFGFWDLKTESLLSTSQDMERCSKYYLDDVVVDSIDIVVYWSRYLESNNKYIDGRVVGLDKVYRLGLHQENSDKQGSGQQRDMLVEWVLCLFVMIQQQHGEDCMDDAGSEWAKEPVCGMHLCCLMCADEGDCSWLKRTTSEKVEVLVSDDHEGVCEVRNRVQKAVCRWRATSEGLKKEYREHLKGWLRHNVVAV